MHLLHFVRRHTALSYFVLVIGWLALYWQILFTLLPLDPQQGPTLLHILLVSVGTSPSLFGLLLTYLTAGKDGFRNLFTRLLRWRVGLAWYLAALLLVPGMNAPAYLLYSRLSGQPYSLSLSWQKILLERDRGSPLNSPMRQVVCLDLPNQFV